MKLLIALIGLSFLSLGFDTGAPQKGDTAPDIELINPQGKKIKLSKLKGKIVLIDFWASWCGPCRKENPNVVEAYQKYGGEKFTKGKGFEVFSVSLDRDKAKWEEAIGVDALKWKNHGFDEGGLVARKYGVSSIPTAFLIDGEGTIIASGNEIRGLKLHIALDGLLK